MPLLPLLPLLAAPTPVKVLDPTFDIEGAPYVMATRFIATVPRRLLGKELLDLEHHASVSSMRWIACSTAFDGSGKH